MRIRDWSIERKFLAAMLVVTLAAILFISAFLIVTEYRLTRQARLSSAQAFVGMIARNSAAALIYDDEQVARQILSGVSAEPRAEAAALYDQKGKLFAWFPTNLPPSDLPAKAERQRVTFTSSHLELFADVVNKESYAGAAYLRIDLNTLHRRFQVYVVTIIAVAAGAVLLVLLLAKLLQRWITRPLLSLSATAETIANERNYSLRAEQHSNDEVGRLVQAFNKMVREVQSTHEKLATAHGALEQAHGKLKNYATDLEREVADRTAELRNFISELEGFSYSVSHDMRAPLRAMQGYAQFLAEECDGQLSAEAKEYVERIRRASTRLDTLIQDILSYSRIARGDMPIRRVDLDRVVSDILAEYPKLAAKGTTIEVERPLGIVLGHEAALTQVLSNLIGNAFKFTRPEVEPHVKVWSEAAGEKTRVYVEDNGIGIAEKDLSRIFRIFERVHGGKTYEGTGIGLSIVKKAVEKMDGTVGVSSVVGVGTRFWFELKTPRT